MCKENVHYKIISVCQQYNAMVENSEPPHILLDATLAGSTSEAIKAFAAALGLPTISSSFGHDNDLREWRELNEYQQQYLIQVLRPNDVIHSLIRRIVIRQNMTNVAILFDKTVGMFRKFYKNSEKLRSIFPDVFYDFSDPMWKLEEFKISLSITHFFSVMNHKFKSIFVNTGISFTFLTVNAKTIEKNLKKLHSLFFVNFFVFGTLRTIRLVLKVASKLAYVTQKYSWFLLTRDIGQIGVVCNSCSLMVVQPVISDECISKVGKIFGSKMEPVLGLSFHFDLYVNSILSIG